MALVVGVNSYGSRADANTYFLDSINNTVWNSYTDEQKDQGLVEATRILERQLWAGEKEDPMQDLEFPRTGLTDCYGDPVTPAESLETIQQAQFEYALDLLNDPGLLSNSDATGTNIKKLEAGSAKITYFRPQNGTRYPLTVNDIIKCFFLGANATGSITGSFASGTCDNSSFTDPDGDYGLNEGYP